MSNKETAIKMLKYSVARTAIKPELEALLKKIQQTAEAFNFDPAEYMLMQFMDMLDTAVKNALVNGKELDAIGFGKQLQKEIDELKKELEAEDEDES